jgi:hypothetical protein
MGPAKSMLRPYFEQDEAQKQSQGRVKKLVAELGVGFIAG